MPICPEVPLPFGTATGVLVVVLIVVYDIALIAWLHRLIEGGEGLRTLLVSVIFVSPVPVIAAAWLLENRPPWRLYSLGRQSWSLMFGDLALALLLAVAAKAWGSLPQAEWHWDPPWFIASVVIGMAVAVAFRIHEAGAYALLRYDSLSKMMHDLVSYPVLAVMVFFAFWPVVLHRTRKLLHIPVRVLAVALMLVWIGTAAHDSSGLDPTFLHPAQPMQVADHPVTHSTAGPLAADACR